MVPHIGDGPKQDEERENKQQLLDVVASEPTSPPAVSPRSKLMPTLKFGANDLGHDVRVLSLTSRLLRVQLCRSVQTNGLQGLQDRMVSAKKLEKLLCRLALGRSGKIFAFFVRS